MAAADVAELEWKKFRKHLRMEVVGPYLIKEFGVIRSLEEEVNDRRSIGAATKDYLKLLRKLNNELGKCRVFLHHVIDKNSKKNIFRFNLLTEKLFLRERSKRLDNIREEMSRIEPLADTNYLVSGRLDHDVDADVGGIIGFDDMAKEMENVVLRNDFVAYGITGMGCVGKTALALKVFHGTRIRQEFPTRIWVSLSDVDMRGACSSPYLHIVRYMLNNLNSGVSEELISGGGTICQLLTELKKRLRKQKYLIVLDGAWQEHPWYLNLHEECSHDDDNNSLSYGLPKGGCGGAVIVTSRQEQLVKCMVGDHSFTTHLDHKSALLRDISCKIFENALQIGEIFNTRQEDVDLTTREVPLRIPNRLWASLSDLDISDFYDCLDLGFINFLLQSCLQKIKDDIKYKIQGLPLAAKELAPLIAKQILQLACKKAREG